MLTADHGPAVSGAMNTIVATRAGKDLVSSLASGLLTIGSRFGGALDEAASMFSNARDVGLTPREFVDDSRKANKLSKLTYSSIFRHPLTRSRSQRYRPQDQEC
jgi:ATP citrate (pro-S)-lyase